MAELNKNIYYSIRISPSELERIKKAARVRYPNMGDKHVRKAVRLFALDYADQILLHESFIESVIEKGNK